jgi:hypothetical protein
MKFIIACYYKTHRNKFSSKGIFLNTKRQSCIFLWISPIYYLWFVIIGIYVGLITFSIKYLKIYVYSTGNLGLWAVGVAGSNLFSYFKVQESRWLRWKIKFNSTNPSQFFEISLPAKHVFLWKKEILSWLASLEGVDILAKGFSCVPGGEFIGFPSEQSLFPLTALFK